MKRAALPAVVFTAMCSSVAAAQNSYEVEWLFSPGSALFGTALALNNSGKVVGTFSPASSPAGERAFIYSNGVASELSTPFYNANTNVQNVGISDSGDVVALMSNYDGVTQTDASYLFRGNNLIDLGALRTDVDLYAIGVSQSGTAFGYSFGRSNTPIQSRAIFTYDTSLATFSLPDNSDLSGLAMSGNGRIAISLALPNENNPSSYVIENGALVPIPRLEGTAFSWLTSINDAGDVVGVAWTNGLRDDGRIFLFRDGTTVDLGPARELTFGGGPDALVLDNGDVFFRSLNAGNDDAILYRNGTLLNLTNFVAEQLGWDRSQLEITGINEGGQLIGTHGDNSFLLTPVVPEADRSLVLLTLPFTLLGRRRRSC